MTTAKRYFSWQQLRRSCGKMSLALALIALTITSSVNAQFPTEPPPPGELRPLEFPDFREATLDNGLRLIVVENNRLPIVSISLNLHAGSRYDPPGREGLADMVAELLTKGTEARTAEQIAEEIESVGANLSAGAGSDFLGIASTVMSDHVELAFELMGDILLNSTFLEEELEIARTRFLSTLRVEQSDPNALATRYFAKEIYGDHPYGRRESLISLSSLTREDVQQFASSRLLPDGGLLVLAGDITLDEARGFAQEYLGAWQGFAVAPENIATPALKATEIVLVHRPGADQSSIRAGNLALMPGDDLFYSATVANRVLGGGSDARLFAILREQHGWTYGAYSGIARRLDQGFFQANTEVGTPVTDSALTEMMVQLRRIGSEIVPDSEMVAAKGFLVGSFPLSIQTPQQVAGQVAQVRLLNLGEDYLESYRERLAAVEPPELMAAAQQVIKPDSTTIVVVGDGQVIYDKLLAIASVRIIDVDGNALTPADLAPPTEAPEYDVRQLVTSRDSFQIALQGNVMGYQVSEMLVSDDALVSKSTLAIPMAGINQETTLSIDPSTMMPTAYDQAGQIMGQAVETHLVYDGARVTGTVQSPSQTGTPTTTNVDTTLSEGIAEMSTLQALLPALPLVPGTTLTYSAFDASDGGITTVTIRVSEPEEVTVPAGTFSAYRVDLTGGEVSIAIHVSVDTPRKMIRMALPQPPLTFELVGSQ